jgi:hypothetical protein
VTKPPKCTPTVVYLNRCKAFKAKQPQNPPKKNPSKKPARTGHAYHQESKLKAEPAARTSDADPDSLQLAIFTALRRRLRVDRDKGYVLDGRPVSYDTVMIETNRVRKANGLEQVGKKAEWRV